MELGQESNSELGDLQTLQRYIEEQTGFVTVIKGVGELNSAVSELRPSGEAMKDGRQVMGVVRLSQLPRGQCFVDALVDGFHYEDKQNQVKSCSLALHEFGDLSSDNLNSIGSPIVHVADQKVEIDGVSQFTMSIRRILPDCDVPSMIGRSVAVTEHYNGDKTRCISAGVVARASIVSANTKQVCTCSGKTLWQERLDRQPRNA